MVYKQGLSPQITEKVGIIMNPLKSQNLVAKILQVYACLNAIAWVILAFIIAGELGGIVAVILCAVGILVSFFIYALGEIIELLNQIKLNTTAKHQFADDEIPEL